MKTCAELVTDAAVERVHGNANFGSMGKREVVDAGVLKYAFGYDTGHTMMRICQEHGLLSRAARRPRLTKKGFSYLRAMFANVSLSEINKMRQSVRTAA